MSELEIFPNNEVPDVVDTEYTAVMEFLRRTSSQIIEQPMSPAVLNVDAVRLLSAHAAYGVMEVSQRGVAIAGVEYLIDDGWKGRAHATTSIQLPKNNRVLVEAGMWMEHYPELDGTITNEPNIYVSIADLADGAEKFISEWRLHVDVINQNAKIFRTTDSDGIVKIAEYGPVIGLIPHVIMPMPFGETEVAGFMKHGLRNITSYIKHSSPVFITNREQIVEEVCQTLH